MTTFWKSLSDWITTDYIRPTRILVVEDDDTIQFLMNHVLENFMTDIQPAHTVREAVGKLRESSYDLVMLDLLLPDSGNVLDVARIISNNHPRTAVVVISGYLDDELTAELRSMFDADRIAFRPKPFVLSVGSMIEIFNQLEVKWRRLDNKSKVVEASPICRPCLVKFL